MYKSFFGLALGGVAVFLYLKFKKPIEPEEDQMKPTTLRECGYVLNENEQLVEIGTGKPFSFKSTVQFEIICELITRHVQQSLRQKCQEMWVPLDPEKQPRNNIFVKNIDNCSKLLMIIQNSGRERVGIWSCSVAISQSFQNGTMDSYINMALELGYGLIILNPNLNNVGTGNFKKEIPGSETPEKHVQYIFSEIVRKLACKNISIIAFGSGGSTVVHLLKLKSNDEILKMVRSIAFIDSNHSISDMRHGLIDLLKYHSKNWKASEEPLGTPLNVECGCPCVSGGHAKNTDCIPYIKDEIFLFLENQNK